MSRMTKMQIQAEGEGNVYFLFAATILGVLDMMEKGIISNTDASMIICLPIMIRTEENTMIHQICSMVEELYTYPPAHRKESEEKIKALCYELMADFSRTEELKNGRAISYAFQQNDSIE